MGLKNASLLFFWSKVLLPPAAGAARGVGGAEQAPFNLTIVVTGEVRGGVFPVNQWGKQGRFEEIQADPCAFYGGATRQIRINALRTACPKQYSWT